MIPRLPVLLFGLLLIAPLGAQEANPVSDVEDEAASTDMAETHLAPGPDPALIAALAESEARVGALALELAESRAAAEEAAKLDFHELWPWIAGAATALLLLGFLLGWTLLDRRVRRQHGGFRTW